MVRNLLRALFLPAVRDKLPPSPTGTPPDRGRRMSRRLLIASGVVALAASGLGYVGYERYFCSEPLPQELPPLADDGSALSTQQQFDKLAETDPVKLLHECLTRYGREVKGGAQFTLRKQERVQGKPKPPAEPPVEVVDVCVRGDVPEPGTEKTAIEVVMKWKSGARKPASDFTGLARPIVATLFSEVTYPDGGKVIAHPGVVKDISDPMDPSSSMAKGQSRFCIRDAGLYRSMRRTYAAWKARQEAGELKFEYLGKRTPEHIGRECHVIRRICTRGAEVDAFNLGGTASTDPKVVAAEGFTEVTIFVDVERWLQLGTELHRIEPDGKRVLVGAYHFRDVQLNPTFAPDTFTKEALKK